MLRDESAEAFEYVLSRTRPFGPVQKRLFILTTILQSLFWGCILYQEFLFLQSPATPIGACSSSSTTTTTQAPDNANDSVVMTSWPSQLTQKGDQRDVERDCVESGDVQWTNPKWLYQQSPHYSSVWYSQIIGLVIGAIFGSFLGDLFGRKPVGFFMFACMSLAHGVVAIADNWFCFLVSRVLTCLFGSAFMICSTVLLVEHVGKHWRDICACTSLWLLGATQLPLAGVLFRHWRYLALSQTALSLPLTCLFFVFKESFRWYGIREKFLEAEGALRDLASSNTCAMPDLVRVCDRARVAILNSMHKRTHTWVDLINTKYFLRHTFTIVFASFISSGVYRCLLERMYSLSGRLYVDVWLAYCVDIPVIFSAIIINKCIGRRWCLFLYATSSGFALICIIVLHVTNNLNEDQQMVTSIAVCGKMGVSASMALVALLAIETYPTPIRCMGLSTCVVGGACGVAIGRRVLQILDLESFHYTTPFIGYGVLMVVVGFSSLALTCTAWKPLPDILPSQHRIISMKEARRGKAAWNGAKLNGARHE